MIAPSVVRDLMLRVWGEQTCRISPGDWPRVRGKLFSDAKSSDSASIRASYRPRFEAAVDTIVSACEHGMPDDLERVIYCAFPAFDVEHRKLLARALIEACDADEGDLR